jgi:predicted dehydrogenase
MSSYKPVKVAVIGCGMISDIYIDTMINRFDILEVVGCYDVNKENAERTSQKYNIKTLTMEDILVDDSIEIVVNLTPPKAHYAVVKTLLEAGKNVYTEKVLSIELEEAAELVKIAKEKNLYLGAAPDTFLGASIQTARYVVESGMIGEITSCYCALNRDGYLFGELSPICTLPGGGIGFDVGIYYVTALLSILGPVKEVSGILRTRDKDRKHFFINHLDEPYEMKCETTLAGTIEFECGTIGNLLFESNTIQLSPEKPNLVLFGTKGIMYMADPNAFGGDVKICLKGNNDFFVMQQSHGFNDNSRGLGVAEMAWSMRKGREPRANKEMAYHALEVLHGISKSSVTKTFCEMQSTFEKMPPIPRGYLGKSYMSSNEESGIAL